MHVVKIWLAYNSPPYLDTQRSRHSVVAMIHCYIRVRALLLYILYAFKNLHHLSRWKHRNHQFNQAWAQSSDVIYNPIETAKENDLDLYRDLVWLLNNAPGLSQTDRAWAAFSSDEIFDGYFLYTKKSWREFFFCVWLLFSHIQSFCSMQQYEECHTPNVALCWQTGINRFLVESSHHSQVFVF